LSRRAHTLSGSPIYQGGCRRFQRLSRWRSRKKKNRRKSRRSRRKNRRKSLRKSLKKSLRKSLKKSHSLFRYRFLSQICQNQYRNCRIQYRQRERQSGDWHQYR
jgi:exonuclease VII large subunit